MAEPYRDGILRHLIFETKDAPETCTDIIGRTAPISPAGVERLRSRLRIVADLHEDGELNDAQLVALVPRLVDACRDTAVLHYAFTPEQRAETDRRARDAIAALTSADIAELNALTPNGP